MNENVKTIPTIGFNVEPMEYKGLSLKQACDYVVKDKLVKMGGEGGLIAVDALGNIELPFNTEGMYRGWKFGDKDPVVKIYSDQD